MTHPLTGEELLEALEIARIEHPLNDLRIYDEIISLELPRLNDDMRAAYDKGRDDQLEQVIGWIRQNPRVGEACPIYDFETETDRLLLVEDIKKAMRPQENNSCPQPQWWIIPSPQEES